MRWGVTSVSIGLRGAVARDVLKIPFECSILYRLPSVDGCTLLTIEPLSQGDRAFNSTYPTGVRLSSLPKYVGRKQPHYNYLQSYKEHYRQAARKN
jgi:hypothetical protein